MKKSAKNPVMALVALFLTAISVSRSVCAVEPNPTNTVPPAFRVVVLHNGNALAGQFEQAADRITLTQGPGHTVRIPVAEVDFIVPRWRDAYRMLRSRLQAGDLDDRLRLAQWCLRYDQVDAATDLLLEMSRQYPQHSAVRALEQQLARRAGVDAAAGDAQIQKASFESADPQTVESRLSIPLEAGPNGSAGGDLSSRANPEASSLEAIAKSMEPAAVTEFTRTIQPLLLNRCGMANCHAPTGRSSFKIQRIPLGKLTYRDLTWINLQNVLQRLDPKNPDDSELLTKAVTPHGRSRRAPIDAHQVRQRERLRQWVIAVVRDETSQDWAAQPLGDVPATPIPTASPGLKALQEALQSGGSATPVSFEQEQVGAGEVEAEKPRPEADPPKAPASNDPFDPEQFNRMHHPSSSAGDRAGS